MAATVADLTPSELRLLIEDVVQEKLVELLGDPDEGLELRPEIREPLERQRRRRERGARGTPLSAVLRP